MGEVSLPPPTVYLFPGQGSQRVGMGADLAGAYPAARRLFARADEILGFGLTKICFEGPEEELRRTANTQPALFVHSMALLAALDLTVDGDALAAGHSLGEWTAVAAAGGFSFADGLKLVRRRGELMEAAGRERPGTMAAILGLAPEELDAICAAAGGTVVVANHNSAAQLVISGETAAVEQAMEEAKSRGARRAVPLPVGGAFHSPLMESAAEGLKAALAAVTLQTARVPIIANATAEPVRAPEEIRRALGEQLLSPVRWDASMRHLVAAGAGRFVEIGAGRVLTGLMRQIDRSVECASVSDAAGVAEFASSRPGGQGGGASR
ncbi:MAG: ACP S-malonyltransferase [Candidatus Eisenbacteria bacterium]|nr:ACP S-malonyltransferase [Candidatus Eisenbacteria bacterium]